MGRVANDARKHVLQQVRDETVPLAVDADGDSADDGLVRDEEPVTNGQELDAVSSTRD